VGLRNGHLLAIQDGMAHMRFVEACRAAQQPWARRPGWHSTHSVCNHVTLRNSDALAFVDVSVQYLTRNPLAVQMT